MMLFIYFVNSTGFFGGREPYLKKKLFAVIIKKMVKPAVN